MLIIKSLPQRTFKFQAKFYNLKQNGKVRVERYLWFKVWDFGEFS
jgi:hypothetical protein